MFNVITNEMCNKIKYKIQQRDVKSFIYADDMISLHDGEKENYIRPSYWERLSEENVIRMNFHLLLIMGILR